MIKKFKSRSSQGRIYAATHSKYERIEKHRGDIKRLGEPAQPKLGRLELVRRDEEPQEPNEPVRRDRRNSPGRHKRRKCHLARNDRAEDYRAEYEHHRDGALGLAVGCDLAYPF